LFAAPLVAPTTREKTSYVCYTQHSCSRNGVIESLGVDYKACTRGLGLEEWALVLTTIQAQAFQTCDKHIQTLAEIRKFRKIRRFNIHALDPIVLCEPRNLAGSRSGRPLVAQVRYHRVTVLV
jgi:hypothetical protein